MNIFLNSIGLLLTLVASFIIVMNYGCVIASFRNKLRGIDKHHSMVPAVAPLVLILADLAFASASHRWIPRLWLLVGALSDISLLCLIALPFAWLKSRSFGKAKALVLINEQLTVVFAKLECAVNAKFDFSEIARVFAEAKGDDQVSPRNYVFLKSPQITITGNVDDYEPGDIWLCVEGDKDLVNACRTILEDRE